MKEVYVLLSDGWGSIRSTPLPFGFAVESEEEAKCFEKSGFSYDDRYIKVKVLETCEEVLAHHNENDEKPVKKLEPKGHGVYTIENGEWVKKQNF